LIAQLREWRDAQPRVPPKPAVPAQFHPSRHRRGLKSGRQMPTAR
jgi:hypothetical protein